jgi:hypothetical protein
MSRVWKVLAITVAAVAMVAVLPDMVRYVKISTM